MNKTKTAHPLALFICILLLLACFVPAGGADPGLPFDNAYQGNGIKIGEVTQNSAVVWARVTSAAELDLAGIAWRATKRKNETIQIPFGKTLPDMEASMTGSEGSLRLSYWLDSDVSNSIQTEWQKVDPERDFTHQFHINNLQAGESYRIRMQCRDATGTEGQEVLGTFRTAPSTDQPRDVSFTVVTGQEYWRRDDLKNGHRIFSLMKNLNPDFFVHTGDVVYYDKPKPFANNVSLARYKWNRQFGLPFQREFYKVTSSYFIKDDHDTLKNDCWPGQHFGELTWEDGLSIFREQVPFDAKSYRTIRWGKHLQIWLVEGREFRSPNNIKDSADKTIWGETQKEWFFKTVTESNATFKILISPTPLVGPDRNGKGDNHANKKFAFEGNQLRKFIGDQKNMFVCCGDRHWQYVSVDPKSGVREFSCGPTTNQHAGGWSNNNRSPMHRYLNVVGGFLSVAIKTEKGEKPIAIFRHYGTQGNILNEDVQPAK